MSTTFITLKSLPGIESGEVATNLNNGTFCLCEQIFTEEFLKQHNDWFQEIEDVEWEFTNTKFVDQMRLALNFGNSCGGAIFSKLGTKIARYTDNHNTGIDLRKAMSAFVDYNDAKQRIDAIFEQFEETEELSRLIN